MRIWIKSGGDLLGQRDNWDAVPRVGDIIVLDEKWDAVGRAGPYPVREVRWLLHGVEIQLQTGR